MPRRPRKEFPDGIYHVTVRGVDGTPIVRDDADRVAICVYRRRAERRFGWRTHTFCVMTNHFHMVVETTRESLSRGMHWLNFRIAQRFNLSGLCRK